MGCNCKKKKPDDDKQNKLNRYTYLTSSQLELLKQEAERVKQEEERLKQEEERYKQSLEETTKDKKEN